MRFVKNVKIASVYAVFIIDDKIMLLLNKLGNITFPGGTIERTDVSNVPDYTVNINEHIFYEDKIIYKIKKENRLASINGILREMNEEITLDIDHFDITNITDILKESTMYVIGLNSKSGAVCFIVNKNMPYDLIMQLQKRVHERTELDDGSLPEYLSEIKEILLLNVNSVLNVNKKGNIYPNGFLYINHDHPHKLTQRAKKILKKIIAVDDDFRKIVTDNNRTNKPIVKKRRRSNTINNKSYCDMLAKISLSI